jgi:hypothetical protein
MMPSSSSTSNSEPTDPPPRSSVERATVPGALAALGWTLVFLILADVCLARVFRPPANPKVEPSTLQRYFEYGRSVEGKLRVMVKPDDAQSAPIVTAGWLGNPEFQRERRQVSQPDHLLVATYGQSFTEHVFLHAVELDPRVEVRALGGPGAPLGHSFALYQRDRREHQAQVVVIGVLASVLPQLVTLTPMTWGFEAPTPYMYPRYRMVSGQLTSWPAPVETLADFRATLQDPARWTALRNLLAAEDGAFDSFLFDADLLDHSTFGRLFRRAIGHQRQNDFTARFHDAKGFLNTDGILDVGRALLLEFGRTAKADGRLPFVIFFDDRGYPGYLDAAFGQTLRQAGIPYLSSHPIAPATDLTNFIPNGHFTPEIDRRMAEEWLAQLYQLRPTFAPDLGHGQPVPRAN